MAKLKTDIYKTGSFRGGSNINLKLITCKDHIVIPLIIQIYVLRCYQMYILHSGMDITEATIHQHFYWTRIRKSSWKEVNNSDTFQRTK